MPRIYAQTRSQRNIKMIHPCITMAAAANLIARYVIAWEESKPGRCAKRIDGLEIGFYFSDGKLSSTIWVDPVPTPANEPKFTPAKGEVPGLKH